MSYFINAELIHQIVVRQKIDDDMVKNEKIIKNVLKEVTIDKDLISIIPSSEDKNG